MHVAITGAQGFVGAGLVRRLLAAPDLAGTRITRLSLIDLGFAGDRAAANTANTANTANPANPAEAAEAADAADAAIAEPAAASRPAAPATPAAPAARAAPAVQRLAGDFDAPAVLDALCATPVDLLFHLASVPGALAEREPALGERVNLLAPQNLVRRLATEGRRSGRVPRLVFASSIAVYGPLGPAAMNEDAPPRPALSYGAHKLVTEVLLADRSRRGELDARSLRLPGIVARPPAETGHGSAFMSLLMHRLAAGQAYDCPVSRDATAWWMSLPCCIDNLLHAAGLPPAGLPPDRVWQLPVLRLDIDGVVAALAAQFGADRAGLVRHRPDAGIEALFGRLPPLDAPRALAAGFRHDGDAGRLVRAALPGA